MRNFSVFLMIGLSMGLAACGAKKHNVPLERAAVREVVGEAIVPTGKTPDGATLDTSLKGRVFATLNPSQYNSEWQNFFMEAILGFVSATDNPDAYGYVNGSPTSSSSTGIYFGGALAWSNESFTIANSYLALEIRDQYTGTKAPNGEVIPAYPVRMPMENYYYDPHQNGKLEAIFSDSYGRIILHGNFTNDGFVGSIKFQNFVNFDGSAPWSGTLGSFKIPTCQIIVGLPEC